MESDSCFTYLMNCCGTRPRSVSVSSQPRSKLEPETIAIGVSFSPKNLELSEEGKPGEDYRLRNENSINFGSPFEQPELIYFYNSLDPFSKTIFNELRRQLLQESESRKCEDWSNNAQYNEIGSFLNAVDQLIRAYVYPSKLDDGASIESEFSRFTLLKKNSDLAKKVLKFKNIYPAISIVYGHKKSSAWTLLSLTQSLAKSHPLEALWLLQCIDFIKTKITSDGKLKKGSSLAPLGSAELRRFSFVLHFLFYRIKTDKKVVDKKRCMQDVFRDFAKAVSDLPVFVNSGKTKRPYLMLDYIMRVISLFYSNEEQESIYESLKENVFTENGEFVALSVTALLENCLKLDLHAVLSHEIGVDALSENVKTEQVALEVMPRTEVNESRELNFSGNFKNKVVFLVLCVFFIGYQLNNWVYLYFLQEKTDL